MQDSEERRFKQHPKGDFRPIEDPSKGVDVLVEHAETRENYDFQWGQPWGDLALALDLLGELTAGLGQHAMYCRGLKEPGDKRIPNDLARMLEKLDGVRCLVRNIFSEKNRSFTKPLVPPQA